MKFAFYLPYPPSLNTYYRMYDGKMLLSEKGRVYNRLIGQTLMLPSHTGEKWSREPLKGFLNMAILVWHPDRRKRDLDNLLKALLDSLQKNGVYEDDSQISEIIIRRDSKIIKGGQIYLKIIENEEFP